MFIGRKKALGRNMSRISRPRCRQDASEERLGPFRVLPSLTVLLCSERMPEALPSSSRGPAPAGSMGKPVSTASLIAVGSDATMPLSEHHLPVPTPQARRALRSLKSYKMMAGLAMTCWERLPTEPFIHSHYTLNDGQRLVSSTSSEGAYLEHIDRLHHQAEKLGH